MLLYLHPIWSIMYEIYALCTLHLRQRFTLASVCVCVWYLPKDEIVGFHISAYWAHAQARARSLFFSWVLRSTSHTIWKLNKATREMFIYVTIGRPTLESKSHITTTTRNNSSSAAPSPTPYRHHCQHHRRRHKQCHCSCGIHSIQFSVNIVRSSFVVIATSRCYFCSHTRLFFVCCTTPCVYMYINIVSSFLCSLLLIRIVCFAFWSSHFSYVYNDNEHWAHVYTNVIVFLLSIDIFHVNKWKANTNVDIFFLKSDLSLLIRSGRQKFIFWSFRILSENLSLILCVCMSTSTSNDAA